VVQGKWDLLPGTKRLWPDRRLIGKQKKELSGKGGGESDVEFQEECLPGEDPGKTSR